MKNHLFRTATLHLIGLAIVISMSAPVWAQEQSVRPGINRHYENPRFDEWVARFERPGREVYDKRHQIIAAMRIEAGMVVADIGAGTGLFTRLFSPRVGPQGRVIAVDISQVFIDNILRIAHQQGLKNIEGIVNTARDVSLPPDSIDVAFLCDTYHHLEYPISTMRSINRALRPGGTLMVIDFRRVPGFSSPWVMRHVRAGQDIVVQEIEAGGFKLVEIQEFLQTNYFLRFTKQ